MRRIRFSGANLARFDRLDALRVHLFIPPEGVSDPNRPTVGDDGVLLQAPAETRPTVRKYTIREIDAGAGTHAIDFVLHEDAGPGSALAARARVGDLVGMGGRRGATDEEQVAAKRAEAAKA